MGTIWSVEPLWSPYTTRKFRTDQLHCVSRSLNLLPKKRNSSTFCSCAIRSPMSGEFVPRPCATHIFVHVISHWTLYTRPAAIYIPVLHTLCSGSLYKKCVSLRKTALQFQSLSVFTSSINHLGTWWCVERLCACESICACVYVCVKLLVTCHKYTKPAAVIAAGANIYTDRQDVSHKESLGKLQIMQKYIAWTIRRTATDPATRKITGAITNAPPVWN